MHSDNNWYGHRFILLKYLEIRENLSIFGSLQHGIHFEKFFEIESNNKSRTLNFTPRLCWNKITEKITKKNGDKNIISIGAPFLYLIKILDSQVFSKQNSKCSGTLLFLTHSDADHKTESSNAKEVRRIVNKIEKENQGPFTACFFYTDLNNKNLLSFFKKRRWNIVCSGNKDDDLMLFKVYNLIISHEKCIFTDFMSPLFYSMFLKKKTQFIQESIRPLSADMDQKLLDDFNKVRKAKHYYFINHYKKKFPSLFKNHINIEQGYNHSKRYLGYDCLKTKRELKIILGWDSFFKKKLAKLIAFLIDLKYGKNIRIGKPSLKKNLVKLYKENITFKDLKNKKI